MFSGPEFAETLTGLGISHVVWIPDSATGPWEAALTSTPGLTLVRVCREGEAWPLAAGLLLAGKLPLVVMQTTGLFESGDALRNVLFDLKLPVLALIGVRNGLVAESRDSAKVFAEPILQAWGANYVLIRVPEEKSRMAEHWRQCRQAGQPGIVLLAEGPP